MLQFFENGNHEWKSFLTYVFLIILLMHIFLLFKFSYWTNKGVSGPVPVIPYGNLEGIVKRKAQFFQPYCDAYFKYKHLPYAGMYSFTEPILNIHDPDIAKLILITDFDHFQAHGIFCPEDGDSLSDHLFNSHGRRWKNLRNKLTPAFSLAKLKNAFRLIDDITNEAQQYIDSLYSRNQPINYSEFYEKYTMELIGNVGFGVVCNGFKNPNSEFVLHGHEYFEPKTLYLSIVRMIGFFAPKLLKFLGLKRVSSETIKFFSNLVKETVEYRQKHNYQRNDYLQTLIDLKNNNNDKGQRENHFYNEFTMKDLSANMMLYMFAGYETSATTGQFATYELALHPHIQNRAREEIREVLKRYNGELTYEAQNEMTYLNMILDETMRKYPPMRALFRRCTKDYQVAGQNLIIEKGTLIFIPIQALQMDPKYFPDPEKFQPERFSSINRKNLHPCVYMPFGEGPRKCLGVRQGYVQSKMTLVKILLKYEIHLDPRTEVPITNKVSAIANASTTGVWIRLKKLD